MNVHLQRLLELVIECEARLRNGLFGDAANRLQIIRGNLERLLMATRPTTGSSDAPVADEWSVDTRSPA
jgi:hypothetical protein